MSGIYKIVNIVNHKMYIGKTSSTFKKRWAKHKSELNRGLSGCLHLQNAWTKYGSNNFKFEVIAEGAFNKQELKQLEEIFIMLYGYYNIRKVSDCREYNKSFRNKMSKALAERWKNKEYREYMRSCRLDPAWKNYNEISTFWGNKRNGRGGVILLQKEFGLSRRVAADMIIKFKNDPNIQIKEGYSKNEIWKYWKCNPVGGRKIARQFKIPQQIATDLVQEFKTYDC